MTELIDTYGFIQPADITRIKLMDLVDGCYTAEPLIVGLPPTTKHVAHAGNGIVFLFSHTRLLFDDISMFELMA